MRGIRTKGEGCRRPRHPGVAERSLLYRGFTALIRTHEPFERFMQGEARCLLSEGVLQLAMMKKDRLSQEKFFELLRLSGVSHLGQVKYAYLEQSGELSVFATPPAEVVPGLPIVPPWDITDPPTLPAGQGAPPGAFACR